MYCNDGNCEKNRQGQVHPAHFSKSVRIALKSSPRSLILNDILGVVYLACKDSIVVIDGNSDKIINSIGCSAKYVALNFETKRAYAVLKNKIAVIQTLSNEIVQYLFEDNQFSQLCIDEKKNLIYAASVSSDSIYIIDGSSHRLVSQIKVLNKATAMAFNSRDNKLFICHENNATIIVIDSDANRIIEEINIPIPTSSFSNSCEPYVYYENNMLYVLLRSILLDGNGGAHELDSLHVFDTNTKSSINVLNPRTGIRSQVFITNDGHESFALNQGSGDIYMTNVSKKKLLIMNSRGEVKDDFGIKKSCAFIGINSASNKLYLSYSGLFNNALEIKYLNP